MKMLKKKIKRMKRKACKKNTKEPHFFLEKLYNILNIKAYNNLIQWNEDGTKIIIVDSTKFSKNILPKYFNHDKYSSFVRQLNLYGFHKINNIYNSKNEIFFNEYFQENKTLKEIKNIKRTNHLEINEEQIKDDEIKEPIILDDINEKDDEKKILEFQEEIKNDNFDIKSNKNILEFLIKKDMERFDFYQKVFLEIQDLKSKNKINFQNIQNLNKSINFPNNTNIKEPKKIYKEEKNSNNILVREDSFIINENIKLYNEFKNANENIIEKTKSNKYLNSSFCEGLDILPDEPKYNRTNQKSSFTNLNRTMIIEPNFNNNANISILKNDMTNSFL